MSIDKSLEMYFKCKDIVKSMNNTSFHKCEDPDEVIMECINTFKITKSHLDSAKLIFVNSDIISQCMNRMHNITASHRDINNRLHLADVNKIIEEEAHKYMITDTLKLPFNCIYILLDHFIEDVSEGNLLCSLLVSEDGYIHSFNCRDNNSISSHRVILRQNIITCSPDIENDKDVLLNYFALTINILTYELLDYISKHQVDKKTINQASTKIRKLRKTIKKLPKDYYTIGLSSAITLHQEYRSESEAKHSYQYDVRGCWVTRMVRGNLPINKWLQDGNPNRTIYTNMNQLPPEMLIFFNSKGITIEEGEWISVLKTWRKDHIRGPEDKPYIPAIRTL